jgi:tRNA(fMet)-specific endonuclease VapC
LIGWLTKKKQEMSGKTFLLDTNAIGLYLNKKDFEKNHIPKSGKIIISVISNLEFLSNPLITVKNKFVFEYFLDTIEIYPIALEDLALANHVVSIRKKYKLKLPDAIIAATAMVNDATLVMCRCWIFKNI